jgi:hypothetical protein
MEQAIQMVGAVFVLGGFVANQRWGLRSDARSYLFANAVGAAILTVCAALDSQVGFVLLEGVWTVVSTVGLIKALRPGSPSNAPGLG